MKDKGLKIVAVICVRMNSERLPGKVMIDIIGKPILGYLVERVMMSELIDEIVVATSLNPENNVIEAYCQKIGVACFRGSEEDVLDRILNALKTYDADIGVEIFGDGPLVDPEIIDNMIKFYIENMDKYDFVSNDLKTTFPSGAEVEVYSTSTLEDASERAVSPDVREHGTLYIRQHPKRYRLHNIEAPPQLYCPDIAIELDTKEDFIIIKAVIENLYPVSPNFTIHDVIKFLQKHPELIATNKNIYRRWKQYRKDEI
ncbi:MAG: glycosyltransferase family protein [Candidatus Omnitrophica bacterium]|nr:glycosyltransferase family protein [Candidatus Omnitrophota bacterium]MDD5591892.1 glycosyltransferase family protein [Candidatus Omnitrophota bacterium]